MIPTILIKSKDFHDAWYRMNREIMKDGALLPSRYNSTVMTNDACVTIELTGNAIEQVLYCELHKDYNMKSGLVSYMKQFDYSTDEFKKSDKEQRYTYAGRMFPDTDTIRMEHLLVPFDKGVQLTTWNKFIDLGSDVRPCFQRMWIRELHNNTCELHVTFRSHDVNAWQFNMIGLVDYARRYLLKGRKIVKIVEFNDSLHIYDYDWANSVRVRKPTLNMRLNYE